MAKEFNLDVELQGGVKITSGTPAAGKILQSDATGNATWETNDGANIDHTGDVVTVGAAATIQTGVVEITMLADGTDGELITWDAAGVATTVPAGTATHVLTSNGAGAEPTFQVIPAVTTVTSVKKTITTAAGGAGTVIAHTLGTADLHVSTYDSAGNKIETEVNVDVTNVTIITAVIETSMVVVISTAANITDLT